MHNKKILITGATGGIGLALSHLLNSQGAVLVVSGTKVDILDKLVDQLGDNVHALPCDMSNKSQVGNLVHEAFDLMDGLDGIVCNAGIVRDGLAIRMKDSDWDDVMQINLKSPFILNKSACRLMMKQKQGGSIVNVSSVVAFQGNPGQANYTASKAGLIAMSKTMAREFASKNIRVNCVAPGFINTQMISKMNKEAIDKINNNIPMHRIGQPDEIAGVISFLLSNVASYITGETIHVNGGLLMH